MFSRLHEEDSRLSDERKREKRPEESAKMTGKQFHISENQVWLLEPNNKHMQDIINSRCGWAGTDPLYTKYHDEEWGRPVTDDKTLFEFLVLESAQAGLSWITILRKREGYRKAFHHFDVEKVAQMTPQDIDRLMQYDATAGSSTAPSTTPGNSSPSGKNSAVSTTTPSHSSPAGSPSPTTTRPSDKSPPPPPSQTP